VDANARRRWIAAVVVFGILLVAVLGFIHGRALSALHRAAREVASEHNLRFTLRRLPATPASRFDWITTPAVFSQAAEFHDHLFLCGPAGLYEYDAAGSLRRRFRVGNELPSSPLTRMAVATLADADRPELLIVTAGDGILAFDGAGLRQIRPADPAARRITAILPLTSGRLLLGTAKLGVLVYDGKRLQPFHPTLATVHVTALAGTEADLWVGTVTRGVLHWHGGQTDSFTESAGLPDPQVLSLLVQGERAFVGTPLGVAEFRQGSFARVVARGAFARDLGLSHGSLFVGTLDQGVVRLPLAANPFPAGLASRAVNLPDVLQIFSSGGSLFALARHGLYALAGDDPRANLLRPSGAVLTDADVSALSLAPDGKLWVGFFDRGLDILDAAGRRARHVENDRVFCVNRIVPLRKSGSTAVATANGLVLFGPEGRQRQVLTRADGLISSHVTDVVLDSGRMIVATPAGVTFLDPGGARSLYAFQGLVNNHVYALAEAGGRILAGTLGGLSLLDKEQVVASYTTANSHLDFNWISAVVPLDGGWMVGTYGGGIVRLDASGRFHSYDVATAGFDVNPNAMLATSRYVLAGTLGSGLYVYDRPSARWSRVTVGLPSENVTALAAGNGFLYIGTDNGLVRIRERHLEQQ
jgi:ligand-binding sensor domain-containing protein